MSDAVDISQLSIVTVCMNRVRHLQRTAPLVSAWPYHQTHIIVDWSSDTPVQREDLPDDSRIQLVRVDGEPDTRGNEAHENQQVTLLD